MSKNGINYYIVEHIEKNFWLYIVSFLCILIGIVFGAYSVKYISNGDLNEVTSLFNRFKENLPSGNVSKNAILLQSFKNNIPILLGIWFLGLTVIGIPIILILDLIKGYTIGFTSCFIISSAGFKGLWITLLGVIPQNIIYVPCIIYISVIAMNFSIMLLRDNSGRKFTENLFSKVISYSFIFFGALLVMCLGSLIESYITPFFIKIIIS